MSDAIAKDAKGYAVAINGVIDVKTVSPTRRAAIVNFLCISGLNILNRHTDAEIDEMWGVHNQGRSARVIPILISEEILF